MKIFAERLKDLRIEKGVSQSELSRQTGISQTSITYWENALRTPNLEYAAILAEYFGVSLGYLAGLEN